MSYRVSPMVLVVRAFRVVNLRSRCLLLCALALLGAGIIEAQPRPGAPAAVPFETPPITDPYQQAQIRELARQNTERFRMRISLPQTAFVSAPFANSIHGGHGGGNANAAAAGPSNPYIGFLWKLLWVFAAAIVWFLVAKKFTPEIADHITSWIPAKVLTPVLSADRMVTLLVEEQAVLEFQAALGAGKHAVAGGAMDLSAGGSSDGGSAFLPAAGHIRELRRLLEEACGSVLPAAQRGFLVDALDSVRSVKNAGRPEESLPLRQVATAIEMLLKQLTEKASNVTSSSLRTAKLGVTVLEELCQPGLKPGLLSEPSLRLLVVDDETFSRYALSHALKRGLTEPDVAENGDSAMKLATRHTYDLIILDVQLPGMDGFELCSKIHETAANRTTPVLFVTSLRDFDARANSIICGGRDLIAKPFLTFELAVKALTLVATERLRGRGRLAEVPEAERIEIAEAPAAEVPEVAEVAEITEVVETADVVEPAVEEIATPLEEVASEPAMGVLESVPEPAPTFERKRMAWVPPVASEEEDGTYSLLEPTAEFMAQARAQIDVARQLVELIRSAPDQIVRQDMIAELFLGVHLLAECAEGSQQYSIALVASTLESLLKKLLENAANVSDSTLLALATATELLQDLCIVEASPDLATSPPIRALVVDDDPVALRAFSNALQMRLDKPESATDGQSALVLAEEKPFDIIFLDVQMPDFDGFEVCTRIRNGAANRDTPIVFVTSHDALAVRAKSEACGGSDIITKPCLGSELNLKALALALRARLIYTGADVLLCAS